MCAHASACIVMQRQLLKGSLLAQDRKNLLAPPKRTANHCLPLFPSSVKCPASNGFQVLKATRHGFLSELSQPTANRLGPREPYFRVETCLGTPPGFINLFKKANHDLLWLCFFFFSFSFGTALVVNISASG